MRTAAATSRRRRYTLCDGCSTVPAYPARSLGTARRGPDHPARGRPRLAAAAHRGAARAGAVAVAFDLAQDLAVHPGRRTHGHRALAQVAHARETLLIARVGLGDLVAQERLARARQRRPVAVGDLAG